MKATANSGSIPDEQPAMIEIVPVGATVVTLQFRSSCIGRMRSPLASRAQLLSGPQMERVDLRERVLVDVDDVVEEVRGQMDVAPKGVPIHHAVTHVVADVDRAEVA